MTINCLNLPKTMLFTLVLALLSIGVFAQPQPQQPSQRGKANPQERAERLTELMTNKLQLNEKQTAAVRDINQRYATKLAALKQNKEQGKGKGNKPRQEVIELRQQRTAELQKTLTPEQFAKYQEMEDHFLDQRQERHNHPKPGGNKPSPEERAKRQTQRLQKELNLTPQQAQQAEQIALKYAQQSQQLRTEQEKQRQTMQDKRAQTHQQFVQEINSLLNPEQKAKFENLQQQWQKDERH